MNIYEIVQKFLEVYPTKQHLQHAKFNGTEFVQLDDIPEVFTCHSKTIVVEINAAFNMFKAGVEFTKPDLELERIVCAANAYYFNDGSSVEFLGVRHCDDIMYDSIVDYEGGHGVDLLGDKVEVQGFWTNRHRFVTRTEAFKIAFDAKQIIRRVGGDAADDGTLYSENLY